MDCKVENFLVSLSIALDWKRLLSQSKQFESTLDSGETVISRFINGTISWFAEKIVVRCSYLCIPQGLAYFSAPPLPALPSPIKVLVLFHSMRPLQLWISHLLLLFFLTFPHLAGQVLHKRDHGVFEERRGGQRALGDLRYAQFALGPHRLQHRVGAGQTQGHMKNRFVLEEI